MTCPSCGSAAPADARFCPACGHSLVARPDERRVATVLFADLVGFTSLSETADPEHIKNLVDRCFERLAVEVTTFGGQVDKVIGDALVALFGAPVAHEDDAERAVHAALRMQERLAEIRDEIEMDVHLRIGVNTGEVLVGALRAGGDYTAMGDVVNTASRLQQVAGPDEVVVGTTTHAAALRGVRYEPLGPITVKGREEPVAAWRAVAAVAPPGHRHRRTETPLVGRESEVAVLRAALATATARKRAHLVLVTGEAGVGKTRLAGELGQIAECEHGACVLNGQCIPYGETNVWWPIAAMVADACEVDLTDPDANVPTCTRSAVHAVLGIDDDDPEVGRVTEGLLYLMREGGPGEGVDPGRAREEGLRAALAFFAGLADAQPLVLVLSDLHWGDDAVLEFVPRLLTQLATRPVVLVGTDAPGAHRPVVARRRAAQHRARQPRPAGRRGHRRAAAHAAPRRRRGAGLRPAGPQRREPVLHRGARRDARRDPRDRGRSRAAGDAARAARGPARPARRARPRDPRGCRGDRQRRAARPGARARRGTGHRCRPAAHPAGREGPARARERRVPVPQRADPRRRVRHTHQGRARATARLGGEDDRRGGRSQRPDR